MNPTDKILIESGYVRFPTKRGPLMVRAHSIDSISPADCGCSEVCAGNSYFEVSMQPADAQAQLADAIEARKRVLGLGGNS